MNYFPDKVDGMTEEECATLNRLKNIWSKKLFRNGVRSKYYEMKNGLEDLGIAIPPQLTNVETAVGWPAKAVDYLSARSMFDGFTLKDDDALEETVNAIMRDNNFGSIYHQSCTSELIHSCAFLTVSKGARSEPDVLVSAYSAECAAAEYDFRKKRIKNGFTIVGKDEHGNMTDVNLYTDTAIIEISKGANDVWKAKRYDHRQGRPLMFALVYNPSLDRPFGKSRINRAVMSLTDSAVRTSLRTEVSAEFFTSPQKYLLGAEDTIFDEKSKWETYLGAIFNITKDSEGDVPQFGQLPQMSMQPHIEYMKLLATRFAGETAIPVSSLGVIHDNPSSAEAIYAATEDLIIEANSLNKTNGDELRNLGRMVIAIARGKNIDELTDVEKSIMPNFRNPAMPSIVSQADAMCKIVVAAPWIGETDVFLEEAGFDESQRDRLASDKRKIEAKGIVAAMKSKAASGNGKEEADGELNGDA